MTITNEFNQIKSLLTSYLQSIDLDEAFISELLTDNFIHGLLELRKEQPENNKFLLMLQNFPVQSNLHNLTELKKELNSELLTDGYISKVFH